MTRFSKFFIAGFALFAMTVSASEAKADFWRHIQELALDIQLKSDRLMGETHHYVHTPNYHCMIRSVSKMRLRAVRVHVLSLQHGCLDEMSREVAGLDRMFHEVERLFNTTEIDASHGYGHVHGNTCHVKKWLNKIEDCIHHIRADIASLRRPVRRPPVKYGGYGGYGFGGNPAGGYGYKFNPSLNPHYKSRYSYGGGRSRGGISYHDRNFGLSIRF